MLAASQPAFAQAPDPARGVAGARTHFEAGAGHYAGRRFREAIREFQRAAETMPSAELWFNIARAHEALGEHAQAVEHYELYLRDHVDAPDAQEVRERIDGLRRLGERAARGDERAQGMLRIDVQPDGATVMLDGRSVGNSPLPGLFELTPGRHSLRVHHPAYLPFRAAVDARPGVLTAAYVDLTPRDKRASTASAGPLKWVVVSLAGAALIGSGTFGALAIASDRDGDPSQARDQARVSDALLGGALVLGITALVLHHAE